MISAIWCPAILYTSRAHLDACVTLHNGLYQVTKQAAHKSQHLQQQQQQRGLASSKKQHRSQQVFCAPLLQHVVVLNSTLSTAAALLLQPQVSKLPSKPDCTAAAAVATGTAAAGTRSLTHALLQLHADTCTAAELLMPMLQLQLSHQLTP
jgi:hypothetical protein